MAVFKSAFSRLHFIIALFAGINILLGIALTQPIPLWGAASTAHLVAGLLLFPAVLPVLLTMKNRRMVVRAFMARLLVNRNDWKRGKLLIFLSKSIAMLSALGYVMLACNAILVKTNLAYAVLPEADWMGFHMIFVYVMPALLAVHTVTMLLAFRKTNAARRSKPAITH